MTEVPRDQYASIQGLARAPITIFCFPDTYPGVEVGDLGFSGHISWSRVGGFGNFRDTCPGSRGGGFMNFRDAYPGVEVGDLGTFRTHPWG